MKYLIVLVSLFFIGCDAASAPAAQQRADLPADVQQQVDALDAGGQVSAAQTLAAQAQSTVTIATAIARSTEFARDATATRDARELEYAHITQTAQARAEAASAVAKTETANANVTADARTAVAKTETANANVTADARTAVAKTESAVARATSFANASAQQTASALATTTAEARANASATYVAQAPTRVVIARIQADEETQRRFNQDLAAKRQDFMLVIVPYVAAVQTVFEQLGLPVFVSCLAGMFLAGMFMGFRALVRYMDSRTLEKKNDALKKRVIVDVTGRPLGFIQEMDDGSFMVEPVAPPALAPGPQAPPPEEPVRLITDMQDRRLIEQQQTTPPDPSVLDGWIHRSSLLAFTSKILADGDWTQATWTAEGHNILPRGYVLTKDTEDEHGNTVQGGYSRLMALFTEKNLIIGRRKGASGRWNPNAPREVDKVMAILCNEAPPPPLPPEPPTKRKQTTKLNYAAN